MVNIDTKIFNKKTIPIPMQIKMVARKGQRFASLVRMRGLFECLFKLG